MNYKEIYFKGFGCFNISFVKITDRVTSLGRIGGDDFGPTVITSQTGRVSVRFSSSELDPAMRFSMLYIATSKKI